MAPLKSKRGGGKEVLQPVSLCREGKIACIFINVEGKRWREIPCRQQTYSQNALHLQSWSLKACPTWHMETDSKESRSPLKTHVCSPVQGQRLLHYITGRISARPRRGSPPGAAPGASPITCRNAPRARCASGKEWWSRYPGWCRCCSRHLGTGFGSDQALAHSRDREQTAAGRLVRKVAVSFLPARLLLAQTVPARSSKLRLPPRPAPPSRVPPSRLLTSKRRQQQPGHVARLVPIATR